VSSHEAPKRHAVEITELAGADIGRKSDSRARKIARTSEGRSRARPMRRPGDAHTVLGAIDERGHCA
jgi:hypothetical protein